MRIAVIGGGPAGLYFAILMKRDFPEARITVVERNRRGRHLRLRRGVQRPDARRLPRRRRAELPRHHRQLRLLGRHRDPLRRRRPPHRRQRLLRLLPPHPAAAAAGARPRAGRRAGVPAGGRAGGLPRRRPDRGRRRHQLARSASAGATTSAPEVDLRPNRFAWMGSTRPFDAFTFFFRERPEGIFIAHCYQYEAGASTWVLETDPETFARAGLDAMDEAASARFMEERLRRGAGGPPAAHQPLALAPLPARSAARAGRGATSSCSATPRPRAHFSIGSGTKLAMEDAIALHAAFRAGGDVRRCLARFEAARREDVEKHPARRRRVAGLVRAASGASGASTRRASPSG